MVLTLLSAAVFAGLSVGAMGWGWEALGASPMTVHGWIALSIGAVGTALLTAGLMILAFHSHRSGHDDSLDDRSDQAAVLTASSSKGRST